jgi:hypothetical protein
MNIERFVKAEHLGEDIMKEILGEELELAYTEFGIKAVRKYMSKENGYQVWELTDKDFKKLNTIPEKDWRAEYGWWRYAKGSNMGTVEARYTINNHYIKAWDGCFRKEMLEKNKSLKPDDRYQRDRKYDNLLQYFCYEIGVSQPRNICALAVDLAKQNNITMAELFNRYQG